MLRGITVVLAIFTSLSWATGAAALPDITGIWTVVSVPSSKVLIERQEDRTRISVAGANALGQPYAWYIGDAVEKVGGAIAFTATAYRVSSGTRFPRPPVALGSAATRIDFVNQFVATLTFGGRQFTIERRALVTDGLTAPIDPEAPETGWYVPPLPNSSRIFVEAQGTKLVIYALGATAALAPAVTSQVLMKSGGKAWGSAPARVEAPTIWTVTGSGAPFGGTAQHIRLASVRTFIEDVSASVPGPDGDNSGLRDDLDSLLTNAQFPSVRVRSALAEIWRAYRYYLVAPSAVRAAVAGERIAAAFQCALILAPGAADNLDVLSDALLFNTRPRIAAYSRYITDSPDTFSGSPIVSLSNPNLCSEFTQGVVRRFDLLSAAELIRYSKTPSSNQDKNGVSRNNSLLQANDSIYERSASRSRTCSNTRIYYLTGVFTSSIEAGRHKEILARELRSAVPAIDKGFNYDSTSNPIPSPVNFATEYLVANFGFTISEARSLIRSGFKFLIKQGITIVVKRTPTGILVGSLLIPNATLNLISGVISDAVVDGAADKVEAVKNKILTAINDEYRVIIVSHSQGNVYGNLAFREIPSDKKRFVRVAAVANPTAGPADGGLGATRDDDGVIQFVPGHERFTIFGAGEPRDWFGHFMVDSYLNNATARAAVLARIRAALSRAVFPTQDGRVFGTVSGGYTGSVAQVDTFDIGTNGVTFRVEYEAYGIPDRFDVLHKGKRLASTGGLVSGAGALTVRLPADPSDPTNGEVSVAVYGPHQGTAWNYQLFCPNGQQ